MLGCHKEHLWSFKTLQDWKKSVKTVTGNLTSFEQMDSGTKRSTKKTNRNLKRASIGESNKWEEAVENHDLQTRRVWANGWRYKYHKDGW